MREKTHHTLRKRVPPLVSRAISLTVWSVAVAILLTSSDGTRAAARAEVVIGTSIEPDHLNVLFSEVPGLFTTTSILATTRTFDVAMDSRWRPVPRGVAALPSLKDGTWMVSGDRMTLRWRLLERSWHDGRRVTCGDYVFSHAAARHPQVGSVESDLRLTRLISNVSCPAGADGSVVVVNWKQRYAYANLAIIEYGPLPRHVLEEAFRRSPARLRDAPFGTEAAATIGDGAYRVVEWKRGSSLTVQSIGAHPILGSPAIRRITWRFFPDQNSLLSAAAQGTVDVVASNAFTVQFDRALALERETQGRLRAVQQPGVTWERIDFNLDHPFLKDVRVRQALAHAVDREAITRRLLQGRVGVSHGYLPPEHPDYTQAVPTYRYDPPRARALLGQAGFTPGPDGILRNAAGQRFSLELNTIAGATIREQVAEAVAQQWRDVGIDVRVQNYPARVLFDLVGHRRFATALYAWVFGPVYDCDQLYSIDGIPTEGNGWEGANVPGYRSGEMDRLCKAAPRETDEAARRKLVHASLRRFALDLPALPLYFGVRTAVATRQLAGFNLGFPSLTYPLTETWNAHQWAWR